MDNRMDNWKGMTEPLIVGDPVRIVKANKSDFVGLVTAVSEILPKGTRVNAKGHAEPVPLLAESYMVEEPQQHAFDRRCLYKLPPDFFDVLDNREAAKNTKLAEYMEGFCKRLQIQDK